MPVSSSIPQAARRGRSHRSVVVAVLAAVIAVVVWAVATYAVGSPGRPSNHGAPTEASLLSKLTPQQRQYVLGIAALTPAQLRAAFGTDWSSRDTSELTSLTPKQRHYVSAIASMSYSEQAAAFGTGK